MHSLRQHLQRSRDESQQSALEKEVPRGPGDEMGLVVRRVRFLKLSHGLKGSAAICL